MVGPYKYGGKWVPGDNVIRLNSRARPREQLHILLHECGHMLVERSPASTRENKYYWGYERVSSENDASQKKLSTTFKHRIDVLSEEIDAWHAGKLLARRLHLDLDQEAFDKTRTHRLKSYVTWSLERRPDDPDDEEKQ